MGAWTSMGGAMGSAWKWVGYRRGEVVGVFENVHLEAREETIRHDKPDLPMGNVAEWRRNSADKRAKMSEVRRLERRGCSLLRMRSPSSTFQSPPTLR